MKIFDFYAGSKRYRGTREQFEQLFIKRLQESLTIKNDPSQIHLRHTNYEIINNGITKMILDGIAEDEIYKIMEGVVNDIEKNGLISLHNLILLKGCASILKFKEVRKILANMK
jgi:hypothetical protein